MITNQTQFNEQIKLIYRLSKDDILVSVQPDGTLKEVGYLSRIWRFFFSNFEDCKVENIAKAISDIASQAETWLPFQGSPTLLTPYIQVKNTCGSCIEKFVDKLERRYAKKDGTLSHQEAKKLSQLWTERMKAWPYLCGFINIEHSKTSIKKDYREELKDPGDLFIAHHEHKGEIAKILLDKWPKEEK